MRVREALATGIESRADAIADFMAAWLNAGARASPTRGRAARNAERVCRALVQDLITWLRDGDRAEPAAWKEVVRCGLRTRRARHLACSSLQEYLRSADDARLEALGCSPEATTLLDRYFLGAASPPRSLGR